VGREIAEEYAKYKDYPKLEKLVQEYILKYSKKLGEHPEEYLPSVYTLEQYHNLIQELIGQIRQMYEFICSHGGSDLTKEVIALDCMIALAQLLELLKF
jgi:hypothetical protein